MTALAVRINTCAALLDVDEGTLLGSLERGEIQGVRVGDQWRISLFELARLLGTSAPELLEYLEDFGLAQAIEEVREDETYSPGEGRAVYESYLRGEGE